MFTVYGVVIYCVGCVVPGAGAFEVAIHNSLMSPTFLKDIKGRARLGVQVLILTFWLISIGNFLTYFYSNVCINVNL